MHSLFTFVIIGLFLYLVFFRRGGVGCCGGHWEHDRGHAGDDRFENSPHDHRREEVIDLNEDQYTIVPSEDDKRPRGSR